MRGPILEIFRFMCRNISQLTQDGRGCNILVAADRARSAVMLHLYKLGCVFSPAPDAKSKILATSKRHATCLA